MSRNINNHFINLPNELILTIIQSYTLDILDIINLKKTCNFIKNLIDIPKYFCKKNIKFITKHNNEKINITSLNNYIDIISTWLTEYKYQKGRIYMPKKISHSRLFKNIELRFTKDQNKRCSFLITDISTIVPLYSNIQVLYEPEYKRYRLSGLDNTHRKLVLPYLLLYIGFKVLFKIHGYNYITCFDDINISYFDTKDIDKIPRWFKNILCNPNYNGMLLNELADGCVEVF